MSKRKNFEDPQIERAILTGFTFYRSFFDAVQKIKDPLMKASFYDSLCGFALYGIEPQFDGESGWILEALFESIRHTLEKSRSASVSGRSKPNRKRIGAESKANRFDADFSTSNEQDVVQDQGVDQGQDINKSVDTQPQAAVPSDSDLNEEFDTLWGMYPRKDGKKEARSAYFKARRRKKDPVTYSAVQIGISRYKGVIKARGTPREYILMGSTFFKGERWNDEFKADATPSTRNQFNAFEQHEYDFEALESELLS